jgi:hypothetical protein
MESRIVNVGSNPTFITKNKPTNKMIQQLIEIRNNILSAIEANDNILAKMAINDLDTLLHKLHNQEIQDSIASVKPKHHLINILPEQQYIGIEPILSNIYERTISKQERMYSEKEVKRLIHLACSHSGIQVFKGFDKWFDKNKK